jgi:hypothetical protein
MSTLYVSAEAAFRSNKQLVKPFRKTHGELQVLIDRSRAAIAASNQRLVRTDRLIAPRLPWPRLCL